MYHKFMGTIVCITLMNFKFWYYINISLQRTVLINSRTKKASLNGMLSFLPGNVLLSQGEAPNYHRRRRA